MISTKIIKNLAGERFSSIVDPCYIADFGFRTLDDITGGLYIDDFVVLAGPTGSGPGVFGSNIVLNVALQGVPVLAFVSRVSEKDFVKGLLDDMAYKKRGKLFEDLLSDPDATGSIVKRLSTLPIYVSEADDNERANGVPFNKVKDLIRDHVLTHQTSVIYIESLPAMGWGDNKILSLREFYREFYHEYMKSDKDICFATVVGGEVANSGDGFGRLLNGEAIKGIGAKAVIFEHETGSAPLAVTAHMVTQAPVVPDMFRLRINPTGSTFEEVS